MKNLQINKQNVTPSEARAILWNKGNLKWLLHDGQLDLYNCYINSKNKIVVWSASRRLGKSFTLCVLAIEACLKEKNTVVKFCCPKQKDARSIIRPLIRDILQTCPKELRPEFKVYEGAYCFNHNGSRIELAGLDSGRAESIRGGSAKICIVDEAGLASDLNYVVRSILLPTTTTTKGKIILASTPPVSSGHDFVKFLRKSEIQGSHVKKTVFENPLLKKEDIQEIIDEYGGVNSVEFRREFLCEIITDEAKAIVPEFNKELQNKIIKEWQRPVFFDAYVGMDIGVKDLTVVLFAYFDFKNNKLIIEDEFVIHGQRFNTKALAEGIRQKEDNCYTDPFTGERKDPYMRVSDTNLTVINDLWQLHGLQFLPTRKDDADAALNNLRIALANEQIIINPKCQVLIRHLETGTWNKARSSYDRSSDNGHFDAIDALKYLIRNVQWSKNPYPAHYGLRRGDDYFSYKNQEVNNSSSNAIYKMMNIKRK